MPRSGNDRLRDGPFGGDVERVRGADFVDVGPRSYPMRVAISRRISALGTPSAREISAARRKAVLDRELDERCYVGHAELFHEAASVSIDAAG